MPAGRLVVRILDAQAEASSLVNEGEIFCAAHIDDYGKLCTETRPYGAPWEEDLTFQVGTLRRPSPSGPSHHP